MNVDVSHLLNCALLYCAALLDRLCVPIQFLKLSLLSPEKLFDSNPQYQGVYGLMHHILSCTVSLLSSILIVWWVAAGKIWDHIFCCSPIGRQKMYFAAPYWWVTNRIMRIAVHTPLLALVWLQSKKKTSEEIIVLYFIDKWTLLTLLLPNILAMVNFLNTLQIKNISQMIMLCVIFSQSIQVLNQQNKQHFSIPAMGV